MNRELKIKIGFILTLILLCLYGLWPSIRRYSMTQEQFEALQAKDPQLYQSLNEQALHLGLDLQGGMHLLLGVRTGDALDRELENLQRDLKDKLPQSLSLELRKPERRIEVRLPNAEAQAGAREQIQELIGREFTLAQRADGATQVLDIQPEPAYARKLQEDVFEQVLETLRNRIDQLGVSEPQIQREGLGSHRILIQLPGLKDPEQAKRVIGKVAELQFRIVLDSDEDKESLVSRVKGGCPNDSCADGSIVVPGDLPALGEATHPGYYRLAGDVPASGQDLKSAQASSDQYGKPSVHFTIKSASAQAFGRLTGGNLGKRMAIVLDGHVKSAPTLEGKITHSGEITGYFTPREAYELALTLRSGALPAGVDYLEQRSVGAQLGADSVWKGELSFLVGTLLVIGFMVFYYGRAGVNAIVCIGIAMLMILEGLALFGATLTLPGIAGLVLTIGMGVDANVLIFERIRDELRLGKTTRSAIGAGFDKAFSAIADSHINTIIAAALLFQFGTGSIRGFAVTLSLGVVASMFAALYISRALIELELLYAPRLQLRFRNLLHWIGLKEENHLDFFKHRFKAFAVSGLLTLLGVAALGWNYALHGQILNWGIDFSGGVLLEARFEKPVDLGEIRATLEKAGFDPTLQQFGTERDVLIRAMSEEEAPEKAGESTKRMLQALRERFEPGGNRVTELRTEQVGPQVGNELKTAAVLALFFALLAQLIYVSARFELRYAVGAIAALFHDAWMGVTVLAVFYMDVDMSVIAALLTIVGYSITDTIVVLDRVRENAPRFRRDEFVALMNASTNEMLSRTLLTSGTALMSCLALAFLGGDVLRSFSVCLTLGIVTGTYSSIYIAAPLAQAWEQWRRRA